VNLTDYLADDLVLTELTSTDKEDVLAELVAPVASKLDGFDPRQAVRVLLEREDLGTTGIGDGVAIPHGKLEGLSGIILVVGRSLRGVDFEALDGRPCGIFFMVLAPEQAAGMHLRILAHISRLLKDEGFRSSFLKADDLTGLHKLLKNA